MNSRTGPEPVVSLSQQNQMFEFSCSILEHVSDPQRPGGGKPVRDTHCAFRL